MTQVEQKNNLIALHSFLNATGNFYFWEYDTEMNLLHTSCQELEFDQLFSLLGGKRYALECASGCHTPLVFWHSIGLIWIIGYCYDADFFQSIHVIGPLNSAENMMSHTSDIFHSIPLSASLKNHLKNLCDNLPTMSILSIFPYTQMLHKALTGQNLARNQIRLQQDDMPYIAPQTRHGSPDYELHFTRVQAVLQHIRDGSLNYQKDWDRMSAISTGIAVSTPNALERGRMSVVSFIALCQHAAIDGGMTPDMAYHLGNTYLESLLHCKTLGDIQTVNHAMYEDFILCVRKARARSNISRQIQICCDYIEINIEQELSIKELAAHIGYTDYYLARKFRKEIGISLSEYIHMVKIERAKYLLRNTTLDIQDISARLHYCSHSYFSDIFRKATSVTPKEYRQKKLEL